MSGPGRAESADVYQLKITLRRVRPPVWRRVLVPGGTTLAGLHRIVQDAMGWTDSHLHMWQVSGRGYADPNPEWELDVEDEGRARLNALAAEGDKLAYWYDFGDDWWHDVLVEQVRPREPGEQLPRCTAGRRACPPEDVGGPWGYADFLRAYTDPEHGQVREWAGPEFDAAEFDLDQINEMLQD